MAFVFKRNICPTAPLHLSNVGLAEVQVYGCRARSHPHIDGSKETPSQVFAQANAKRVARRIVLVSETAAYDYWKGTTYRRNMPERRGRTSKLKKQHLSVYNAVRKHLQENANNQYHVTWQDIAEEGGKVLRKKKLLKRNAAGLAAEFLRKRIAV